MCASVSAQWVWTPETGRFVNVGNLPKETPELQIEHARGLMVEGDYSKALAETAKFKEFYVESELADENQFLRGEIRLAKGERLKAAEEFQQVITQYPATGYYDRVIAKQYEIGDALFEEGVRKVEGLREIGWYEPYRYLNFRRHRPLKQAVEVYSMVIDNQPFTAQAAEAQYKLGRCHFAKGDYIEASFEFKRVLEDYRGSEWLDEAAYDLARCYQKGSHPPDYDQAPSQLAVDSINDYVLTYPSDPRGDELLVVKDEMQEKIAEQRFRQVKFYERRSQFDASRIYAEGVVVQYPETRAGEKARNWLAAHPARDRARSRFIGPGYIE